MKDIYCSYCLKCSVCNMHCDSKYWSGMRGGLPWGIFTVVTVWNVVCVICIVTANTGLEWGVVFHVGCHSKGWLLYMADNLWYTTTEKVLYRSMSVKYLPITSKGWFVCLTYRLLICFFILRISSAWIWMSVAWPWTKHPLSQQCEQHKFHRELRVGPETVGY